MNDVKTAIHHACGLALASSLAFGCASDPSRPKLFSTDWVNDQGRSIQEVQAKLRGVANAPRADVAVAVAGNADKLVGLPLAGGPTWTFAHALDARPVVTGDVVVGTGGGELFALDAASGKRLWTRPTGGLPLLGAGDDGNVTAAVLARPNGATLLVVGRDGQVRRQMETEKTLGDPAVVAGTVFVPWQNQYVSAIDASTGDEVGRAVLRDKVTRAQTIGGSLWFGEAAYVRFDEKIGQASQGKANRVAAPSRELPGTPKLMQPGDERLPAVANAHDRDRLFARPAGTATSVGFDSGRFYASYYQLVMGFDAQSGNLAWVHTHPNEILGGEAITSGVALCDEIGKLVVLDAATGQVAQEASFGEPIKSCVVNADSYRAPAPKGPAVSLAEQIRTAVTAREATLATAQRLLLRELATLQDEGATKTLVDVASDARSAPVLVTDARAAIAARRNGASYMLAALGKRYDYLKDVLVSPPVGPLADALAAMKEKRAAPMLAASLSDPTITEDDVKRAAAALVKLGTKDEVPALRAFFSIYRGTAASDDIATAVANVAAALVALSPKEGRDLVAAASKDPMTAEAVRLRLEPVLAAQPAAAAPAKAP